MGNHKFKLSSMIPSAWFYKLKCMSTKPRDRNGNGKANPLESFEIRKETSTRQTSKRVPEKPSFAQERYHSYRFSTAEPNRYDYKLFCNSPVNPKGSDTHFPLELPRKSSYNRNFKRKSIYSPSPRLAVSSSAFSPRCSCSATLNSFTFNDSSSESEFLQEPHLRQFEKRSSFSGSCNCRDSYSTTDIILEKFDDYNTIQPTKFNLITTTTKVTKTRTSSSQQEKSRVSIKVAKKERNNPNPVLARTSSIKSTTKGVKLRKNTPKLARKSVSSTTKSKKFTESLAIVKNSNDPERDFKDSMMEMIVENNIRASKDLEELLACYLLLNSNEYHDHIVKAFEHIWFDRFEDRI